MRSGFKWVSRPREHHQMLGDDHGKRWSAFLIFSSSAAGLLQTFPKTSPCQPVVSWFSPPSISRNKGPSPRLRLSSVYREAEHKGLVLVSPPVRCSVQCHKIPAQFSVPEACLPVSPLSIYALLNESATARPRPRSRGCQFCFTSASRKQTYPKFHRRLPPGARRATEALASGILLSRRGKWDSVQPYIRSDATGRRPRVRRPRSQQVRSHRRATVPYSRAAPPRPTLRTLAHCALRPAQLSGPRVSRPRQSTTSPALNE